MPEANVEPSRTPPPLVVAGRLALLLLASVATVWAFAFSGDRGHAAGAGEPAHVHGASAQGEAGHEHHAAAKASDEPAHAGHQHEPSLKPHDHRVIGTAQRRVFTVEVRAPAWLDSDGMVTAVLREDQLAGLAAGADGLFFRTAAPAEGAGVRLSAEPPAPWDKSTSRVRFRLEARASGLRPGEVGWVKLAARSRELLVVPSGALLYSPAGPYVLAVSADGALTKRRVEIGSVSRGLAAVLSGLQDGETIVVGGAFSWDAERRLRPQHEEIAGVMR